MPLSMDMKLDDSEVRRYLKTVQDGIAGKATVRALNDTARRANTEAVRGIAKRMGVTQRRVRKTLKLTKANPKTLAARIVASGLPLPLADFGARQTRRGVKAKAWGKTRLFPRTFLVRMSSGHLGVFRRTSSKRLPIKQLWGPSVPKEFQTLIADVLMRKYRQRFRRELVRQVNLLTDQAARRKGR